MRDAPTARPEPSGRSHTVLVVDDEPNVRSLYVDALEEAGHRVEVASDGAEALHRLRTGPVPCVVLTDVRMPRMDGWELSRAVDGDPQLASVPVVTITGDRVLSWTSPARDKPFSVRELDALVERTCRLHRTGDPGLVPSDVDRG
jgi:DNA-binding response OmpR family regulator